MARALLTLLLALLVSTIIAAPTKQIRKRSFKVHRIENKNYVPDGKMAMKRAMLKFGLGDIEAIPQSDVGITIKNAANTAGTENGETAAAATQNDAQFLSPIEVGGQKMIMNFDTGSSDLWVFSDRLNNSQKQGRTVYDSKKSKTFKESKNTFQIRYGDGSFASGPVGFDTVDIGGSTVDNQAIGLADTVSQSFVRDTASNGLVGLAFGRLNTASPTKQKTFFENVAADLTEPVFTAQLKGGQVGAYEFGVIDTTAFKGQLTQVPVDATTGFWEFKSSKVKVNGKTTNIAGSAIADTGTSLMLVGNDTLTAYWSQVQGAVNSPEAGGFIFPCNAKLPDMEIAAGDNYMVKVPGVNMNFATFSRGGNAQSMCFGGLQSRGNSKFSIYGDVWFKSQFVAFQLSGPSLGLAPHA